jgi:coenzyme F420-reducing hydrogenase gamma subunit
MSKKLKIGWFSFSCCEDSTIVFTELLNDHYKEWKELIDFKSILVMQKKEDISDLDVAFIEGAITSGEQEEKVKFIRSQSKKIIAIGSCAIVGMPSGQRNAFSSETIKEISPLLFRFKYADKVKKLSEVIAVDDVVPGCPMDEKTFLNVLDKNLKAFGII